VKRKIGAALLVSAMFACSSMTPNRYWQFYEMIEPVKSANRQYEDAEVRFRFIVKQKKIKVFITNKTDRDITLLWSKVRFVDSFGAIQRVANFQTIFTKNTEVVKNVVVPAGETVDDILVPIGYIKKLEEPWAWEIKPLFDQADEKAELNLNKKFSIIFPVLPAAGGEKDYRFDFKVAAVLPHQTYVPR